MSTVTICGRTDIQLPDIKSKDKNSFLWWTKNHWSHVQVHIAAQFYCLKKLDEENIKVESVTEYFGGSGFGSALIQNVLKPEHHVIYDLDDECVEHLEAQPILKSTQISKGDAKETMLGKKHFDLRYADFWRMSAYKLLGEWKQQCDSLFSNNAKAVYMADTSIWSIYLQKQLFENALGCKIESKKEYLNGYSKKIWDTYGYRMSFGAYRDFAAMIFVKDQDYEEPELRHVTVDDGRKTVELW
tara:strand:+ start:496 stop:1224 length:729 start_codon:yes stop_codon:yes gene_type:complete